MAGTLYLIPVPLGPVAPETCLPPDTLAAARRLDRFVVERAKTARAHLKAMGHPLPLQSIAMQELNEHTPASAIADLLAPLVAGHDLGLLSEAGLPAVADPGAALVQAAHALSLVVEPLSGPSSLLLALAASGLNGQNFAFVGYLPQDAAERAQRLRQLETLALKSGQAQLFIETPYRNAALWQALLQHLQPGTRLATAAGLTLAQAQVQSRSVAQWRALNPAPPDKHVPVVFALGQ